jgi:aspartate/methionine/tyrosine aminotransferase
MMKKRMLNNNVFQGRSVSKPRSLQNRKITNGIATPFQKMNALPRQAIEQLGSSKIREVANAGLANPGSVLPFWFGEPANVTPKFIRDAAKHALDSGDTFYHHNLGSQRLRASLAQYITLHHRQAMEMARVIVTGSGGVNALMLAMQAILDPGDEVVAIVPLWPNITEIPSILGAHVERVPLGLHESNGQQRWHLDIEHLKAAISPSTKAVLINSPNNPTGWVATKNDLTELLAHCRTTGTWIISDEAYERLVFDGTYQAPSILDICTNDDRVIVCNTFSKSWQMTGWRLGWLVIPGAMEHGFSKIIEFNSSCAPGFIQQAAVVAVEQGETTVKEFVDSLNAGQRLICDYLATRNDIEIGYPDGAMYVFFKIKGVSDSLSLAKTLVREAGIGLAPGIAFGLEGEGYLRWCIAKPNELLQEGIRRFDQFDFSKNRF